MPAQSPIPPRNPAGRTCAGTTAALMTLAAMLAALPRKAAR